MISDFSGIYEALKTHEKRRLVVANGVDEHSLEAVSKAAQMGFVSVVLTGNKKLITNSCNALHINLSDYEIVDCSNEETAVLEAVRLVKTKQADIIMKGLVSTDVYMRAILNKENGLLPAGAFLTHVSLIKNPNYHKLLVLGDVAIVPAPTLEQKSIITEHLIAVAHRLGIVQPKVAFVAATEKVIEKMPACTDALALRKRWEEGQFSHSWCDGPMALDLAIDRKSAEIKGFESRVAGDADCLLFPNIESGNVFYKTNAKLCGSHIAAIVMGTSVPTVLSSRGDDMETKLNSIALAAILG